MLTLILLRTVLQKKAIYGTIRRDIGKILRELCRQQGVELIEGYAMNDHIHMLLMIPPKYSVANTVGFLKGKSAIRIFRDYLQVKRNFTGRPRLRDVRRRADVAPGAGRRVARDARPRGDGRAGLSLGRGPWHLGQFLGG